MGEVEVHDVKGRAFDEGAVFLNQLSCGGAEKPSCLMSALLLTCLSISG